MKLSISATAVVALVAWASARPTVAVPVYARGHADIGVEYATNGGPHLVLRARFGSDARSEDAINPADIAGQTLAPTAMAVRVRDDNPPLLREVTEDVDLTTPTWDFLGVAVDEPIWWLPQSQDPLKPFFGFATDNLLPPQWSGPLHFYLEGIVSGPVGGEVSLWQSDFSGNPQVKFASYDGIEIDLTGVDNEQDDDFSQGIGGHDHYNWGFSQPGVYQVQLGATGNRIGVGTVQGSGIFTFLVGDDAGNSLPGDYDRNGVVDGADFLLWQRELGNEVTPGEGADGDRSGVVDAGDLDVWREWFGKPAGSAAPVTHGVPEPASLFLLSIAWLAAGAFAWRGRRANSPANHPNSL